MSPSGKDADLTSLASDASLLRDKDAKSDPKSKTWSFLSRLSGPKKGAGSSSASTPSSSTDQSQGEQGQGQTNAVENLYKAYPNMGTSTRLT